MEAIFGRENHWVTHCGMSQRFFFAPTHGREANQSLQLLATLIGSATERFSTISAFQFSACQSFCLVSRETHAVDVLADALLHSPDLVVNHRIPAYRKVAQSEYWPRPDEDRNRLSRIRQFASLFSPAISEYPSPQPKPGTLRSEVRKDVLTVRGGRRIYGLSHEGFARIVEPVRPNLGTEHRLTARPDNGPLNRIVISHCQAADAQQQKNANNYRAAIRAQSLSISAKRGKSLPTSPCPFSFTHLLVRPS